MKKVYVKTLGCKVNTYDTHALENEFKRKGYDIVKDPKDASISVLNTCSVTENADKDARYHLRRFKRDNPEAVVVATGCYAQTDSKKLVDMDEVDLVFPNEVKDKVVEQTLQHHENLTKGIALPDNKLPEDTKAVSANKQGHFKTSLTLEESDSTQTRAFLKIQDGCNGFCSYCLIPYARGASRSADPADVKKEVRRLIDIGTKEIVFAGIHIGDYGEDINSQGFVELLDEMLDWDDMIRIRISSLEPRECSEDLIKMLSRRPELFCDHFHLPLQAGNDRILKYMRRTYDTNEYAENIEMARSYFPDANFGADVIPGFPGETDEEFMETMNFIEKTGLNYLHVFPYSKRPNTAAARMPGHLPQALVKERAFKLREQSKVIKEAYIKKQFGKDFDVLWENSTDSAGRRIGRTPNYLEVVAPASMNAQANTISRMTIKGFIEKDRVVGIPTKR